MKYGKAFAAGTILTALVAAVPLTASAADTLDQAKEKTKSAAEATKNAVTDSWITSKTKIALFSDERVKGTQVHVDTAQGVVHLRGKVDSQEAKDVAAEVAKSIDGVTSVKNDLQVVAPVNRKTVDANDKDITKAVEGRFSHDVQLKKVDVRADAGVVTLSGEVPTITASAKASEQARAVPGVRSVKNELAFSK
jgi:osmotically-inducible protein OsmY